MEGARKIPIRDKVKDRNKNKLISEKNLEVYLHERHRKVVIKTLDINGKKIVPNGVVCIYKRAIKYICGVEELDGYKFIDYKINLGLLSNVVEIELIYKSI